MALSKCLIKLTPSARMNQEPPTTQSSSKNSKVYYKYLISQILQKNYVVFDEDDQDLNLEAFDLKELENFSQGSNFEFQPDTAEYKQIRQSLRSENLSFGDFPEDPLDDKTKKENEIFE